MKRKIEPAVVEDEESQEQWELSKSNEAASEFLEEVIIPLVDQFEFENEEEHYIPGVASFLLYIRLVESLSQNGWSIEELKQAVDEFSSEDMSNYIH